MAEITEVLRIVVDVVAERNAALRERDAARAQLRADDQRAWEALGKTEGTHDTTNVQRLCAEVERLRAELRRMSEWHDEIADTVPCDVAGPHYGIVEWHRMVVAERDAARAEVERMRGLIREYVQATDGLAVEDSAEAQNRYERAEDALREVARG